MDKGLPLLLGSVILTVLCIIGLVFGVIAVFDNKSKNSSM